MTDRAYATEESIPGTEPYSVVVRQLGAGGHGTVYLVRHVYLTKKRAVMKVLHANLSERRDLADRMEREAQTLAGMDHRNIVGVIDAGVTAETPPRPYFVMEYLRGESLRHLIAAGGVGFKSATKVAIEVADALEYAHTKHGVIHRDIKPDNIFIHVSSDDTAITKLLDFGVMHVLSLDKRQTGQHIIGTPQYMAPEQLAGRKPTPQSDLYALGLVLYEMLTGKGPFDDETSLIAIGEAHLRRQPPELNVYRLPQSLKALVKALLAKDPKARPPSAAAVAASLRQIRRELEAEYGTAVDERTKTDPTPMENRLVARRVESDLGAIPTAVEGPGRAAKPGASTAADAGHDTQHAALQVPQGGSTLENANPLVLTLPMDVEAPPLAPPGDSAPIDRRAETRSLVVTPDFMRPRSWTDTEELAPEAAWAAKPGEGTAGDAIASASAPGSVGPAAGRVAVEKRNPASVAGTASSVVVPLRGRSAPWRVASIAMGLLVAATFALTARTLMKHRATATPQEAAAVDREASSAPTRAATEASAAGIVPGAHVDRAMGSEAPRDEEGVATTASAPDASVGEGAGKPRPRGLGVAPPPHAATATPRTDDAKSDAVLAAAGATRALDAGAPKRPSDDLGARDEGMAPASGAPARRAVQSSPEASGAASASSVASPPGSPVPPPRKKPAADF